MRVMRHEIMTFVLRTPGYLVCPMSLQASLLYPIRADNAIKAPPAANIRTRAAESVHDTESQHKLQTREAGSVPDHRA